jgi:hypothetical protein
MLIIKHQNLLSQMAQGPFSLQQVWWFLLKTTQRYGWQIFAEFRPQNSAVAVPEGTGGGTQRDRGGCIKAK